jgi:enoyl-CoA hydratase/carnithine racemase
VAEEPNLLVQDHGRVRVLTFNRPTRLNAFDGDLYGAVADQLDAAGADDSVHVIVLTGSGRAFSAGADRSASSSPKDMAASFGRFLDALSVHKPLIAAVNGIAVGIGVTMLPHCDLVVVDESARLRLPFTALGVAPEAGSSVLLPLTVGYQQAALMFYTSDWVSAEEAVTIGLALRMAPQGAALEQALELAQRIAAFSLASLVATRRTLLAGRADALSAARTFETQQWTGLSMPPMP